MQFTDALSGTFDWTHTESEFEDGSDQASNIPEDTAKVFVDWAPQNLPFGGGVSATWVGDLAGNAPSGLGRVEYGDYFLVDLNARWYLDQDRKHRLGLRVENLMDEEYFSSLGRGFVDITGTPYLANNLGRGQSFHVNYTYDF